jgi:ribonuclease HII
MTASAPADPTPPHVVQRFADRLVFERRLLRVGLHRIVGVDEAGRGPLAGPVFAAAVILPASWLASGLPESLRSLNDSKQLTAAQREDFFEQLTSAPDLSFAIAGVEAPRIDEINILRATHQAMLEALRQLGPAPEHVLVDGCRVTILPWAQTALVGGDGLSYSIAAASVLAKVTRDHRMLDYDRQFPGYGFARHKGYATPQHLDALRNLGPCPIHRRSFAPLKARQGELFAST